MGKRGNRDSFSTFDPLFPSIIIIKINYNTSIHVKNIIHSMFVINSIKKGVRM